MFSSAILFSYAALIFVFYIGGLRTKSKKHNKYKSLSVVIPFRNEEKRMEPLIASINRANYENIDIEFIFIDDNSLDQSISFIERHLKKDYQLVESSQEGKKQALSEGISMAKNEYILTLDADVYFESDFFINVLKQVDDQDCIVLPVRPFAHQNKVIQHLDVLEFKSLQTATFGSLGIGQPFLSNGANLLFKKKTFLEVDGYSGNNQVSSGDDQFLLNKFRKAKKKITGVLDSSVMVTTLAESSFLEFVRQRIRWSSKSFAVRNFWTFLNTGLILTINLAVVIWLLLLPFSRFVIDFIGFLMIKLMLDYVLILHKRGSYELGKSVYYIPLLSIVYPFYLMFLVPAGLIVKPKWKGRFIKK